MIYVACPPAYATGGTELLHQFVVALLRIGVDAKLLYHGAKGDPVAPRFRKYAAPYVIDMPAVHRGDVLVVPEVLTDLLSRWQGVTKVIWWLSVDFYWSSMWLRRALWNRLVHGCKPFRFDDPEVIHFVQSRYAHDFLVGKGIRPAGFLTDYLGDEFLQAAAAGSSKVREPVVAYNPKKGISATRRLIRLCPDLKFAAIEHMTPAQVAQLLGSASAYIDFGDHPGKDRIPREAAISGCVVLVGLGGSARNDDDVPIPRQFKFSVDDSGMRAAAGMLRAVVGNYDRYAPEFAPYRESIVREKAAFESQVKQFSELVRSPRPSV